MDKKTLYEYVGWYGVVAVVVAYIFLNAGKFTSESIVYQFLNLTGALGIGVTAQSKKDTQSAVVNYVWAAIAVFGMFQILK